MRTYLPTSILVLILLGLNSNLVAQKSNYPRSLWIGIHTGAQLSKYQFVPSVSQNQHLGKHIGIVSRMDLEKGASLQAELNYVSTGWQERYDDSSISFSRKLQYLELPIMSHLYIESSIARFFINIGPYIGYYLGGSTHTSGSNFTDNQLLRQTTPIKYKLSWGLQGGPGVSIKLGNRHRIELESRVLYNFQDIWSNKRSDAYSQSGELRFSASLNYLYKF